jgi:hypothetical protein
MINDVSGKDQVHAVLAKLGIPVTCSSSALLVIRAVSGRLPSSVIRTSIHLLRPPGADARSFIATEAVT